MKTSEMKESKFLRKDDVGRGMLLTITGCIRKNVAKEGADAELKWCLTFEEEEKPLVLNAINIQLIEQITSSDDTDFWVGKRIVAYTDPTVAFGGKIVGGIRVRKPKATAPPAPPVQAKPEPADYDDAADDLGF